MAPEAWEPANRWGYRAKYTREQLTVANEVDPGVKDPQLHLIQGEDLNWRVEYMQTLIKSQDWTADFGNVFDVILEEVVNANLKLDKMVKKVFALTTYKHFLTGSNFSFWGEIKMSPFVLLVYATTFTSPKLSFL
ncbi:hypothetical protein D8674_027610 [Pyrus ussuriensis x Pyrus communis]|uniref:DUF7788 domain-containing protein n=1 Tax=Pyrus ussuriensis x Pyrus communis TaxID=2448454 RepID=A0A5N5IA68_9ROSA|nr:hypothetical protein D8674_027610 [Pyrus ussuriensis x Pyrus communis]